MVYTKNNNYELHLGMMQEVLPELPAESVDAVITDPPYELGFMGKSWDNSGVAFQVDTWKRCWRVLKPGGYLLAFGGTRTFHRIACAIEDAGFEIRDTIMWLYGSGFPKSMNIGLAVDKKNGVESIDTGISSPNARPNCTKENTLYESGTVGKDFTIKQATNEWAGWGTCLKPAYEPIIVARKPFQGSLVDNILEYRVGGLNIDECRVPFEDTPNPATNPLYRLQNGYKTTANANAGDSIVNFGTSCNETNPNGRFPANVLLTYDDTDENEVCDGFPQSKGASSQNNYSNGHIYRGQSMQESSTSLTGYREWYNDSGSASRYFYCAKASKRDRDEGLDLFEKYELKPNVSEEVVNHILSLLNQ